MISSIVAKENRDWRKIASSAEESQNRCPPPVDDAQRAPSRRNFALFGQSYQNVYL
ncbi:hypothetical protein [Rhizobium leguminosarum]|uniref:hypothetical protein n=1 Tax=Rhizobium leguminosarum TaxID=384 RepID=UPI00149620A9|nr:hypothetical protein [Rhizobium leguminosarum]